MLVTLFLASFLGLSPTAIFFCKMFPVTDDVRPMIGLYLHCFIHDKRGDLDIGRILFFHIVSTRVQYNDYPGTIHLNTVR